MFHTLPHKLPADRIAAGNHDILDSQVPGLWHGTLQAEGPQARSAPARPAMQQARDRAIAGGLHASSVGSSYPFHAVAIANGDNVEYEVWNLQTGHKLHTGYSDMHVLRTQTANEAMSLAESAFLGRLPTSYWRFA